LWLATAVLGLALTVWLGSLVVGAGGASGAIGTPTPTKTPLPAQQETETAANALVLAPLPTITPIPTPMPTPGPAPIALPAPVAEPPAAWVEAIARAHGLDADDSFIVVDQNNQQMHVVEGGRLARILPVTTGDPRYGWTTPAWSGVIGDYWGTFQGRGGVWADEGWFLFDRPGGSFLIHSLPYTQTANGEKVYKGAGDLGAWPASNGCIRLAPADAAWFSSRDPQGLFIIILPYTGLHGAQG
jgi:lipoprotein-anchoring transpeptidase ErfK/SrfK